MAPAPDSSGEPRSSVYTVEEFDAIYREHANRVFRQAWRLAGRREIAEEIAADTFLTLYRSSERLPAERVAAWLLTVARNLTMDYWRRRAVEQRHLESVSEPVELPAGTDAESLFSHPSLKPEHRACLILRYVHGLERAEIAQQLGLSDNQVKSYLQYSLVILRRSLERKT